MQRMEGVNAFHPKLEKGVKELLLMQEVTVQYNLCNEPWSKYSMQGIADRGLKPSQLTSARFFTEVLFLETSK